MQHEAPPPPPISLDDPACVTIDEAARFEIIRTGHGAPATRNTLRRWSENGVGGIRIPTKTQRVGRGHRVVTTPEALRWFDDRLAELRHPRLVERLNREE